MFLLGDGCVSGLDGNMRCCAKSYLSGRVDDVERNAIRRNGNIFIFVERNGWIVGYGSIRRENIFDRRFKECFGYYYVRHTDNSCFVSGPCR